MLISSSFLSFAPYVYVNQALLELAWDGTSPVHNGRARESSRNFAR